MKHSIPFFLILLPAIVCLLCAIDSCTKNKNTTQTSKSVQLNTTTSGSGGQQSPQQVQGLFQKKQEPQPTPIAGIQRNSFQLQPVNTEVFEKTSSISNQYNNFLLQVKPYARLQPFDFEIGELADYYTPSADESKIIAAIIGFFDSVLKGEIKKDVIDEPEYLKIFRVVSPSIAETVPAGYRIGKIKFTGRADSSALIRVWSSAGSTSGIVYLAKRDAAWLITDIQIDFSDYQSENKDERFMPTTYKNWMY
jgi:hypothetical protein